MNNIVDLKFKNTFSTLTSDQIIEKARKRLSDFRFAHCIRTAHCAAGLAEVHGADIDRAKLAGFLHDYAKEVPVEEYKRIIVEADFDPELLNWNRGIWHGIIGAYIVEQELDIHDPYILEAIRNHTTGDPEMSLLDKVIYMADYIEPGRKFEGVQRARELTALDIDLGVSFQLRHTLVYLIEHQVPIYPKTFATYNVYGVKQEY